MSEIDVSKCEYKGGIECHIRDYPILNCADVKIGDCHYKQLQQLKIALDNTYNDREELKGEYNKLKSENEELKSEIRQKKMTIMMNNDHYHNVDIQNRKYKQCLDEIEEIVNKYKVGSGILYGTICIPDVIQIAEKIKEVKGNE